MQDDEMILIDDGEGTSEMRPAEAKPQEMYTKPTQGSAVSYIEREVDRFDFDGFEVVRRELFSKALCPAVTMRYGYIMYNLRAIRKLEECLFIQILINPEKKLMIVKPCGEDEKDSIQWSKVNKHGKMESRMIRGKYFTAQLFSDMKWSVGSTTKSLGTLVKCGDEKIFVFDLMNAEAYRSVSAPSPDNPNRRIREPLMPQHWQGHYGQTYEESQMELVKTFEGVPEGFVKITLPPMPTKRSTGEQPQEIENVMETVKNDTV